VTAPMSARARWCIVVVFAVAMAWMEAATVFYIRTLVGRIEPYQAQPLPLHGALGNVELWREGATLVLLAAVGWLAGRTWRQRAGYAAIAFGVWDVLYYVFLRLISGWPHTLLDWDILFLLPLPWWGPVLAPMIIAVLMIVWGTLATRAADRLADENSARWIWAPAAIGVVLALGVFMTDALRVLPDGRDAILQVLPAAFNWPLFSTALVMMATPVAHLAYLEGSRLKYSRGRHRVAARLGSVDPVAGHARPDRRVGRDRCA
jgi:hypothetical protein